MLNIFFVYLSLCRPWGASDTLSVISYNVLNFPDLTGNARIANFRTILNFYHPDLLTATEYTSESGAQLFLDSVLNYQSATYTLAPYYDGDNTDVGCYYRLDKLTLKDTVIIHTDLRDIMGYTFSINHHEDASFRFTIFVAHLKSSIDSKYEQSRWEECKQLQNYIATRPSDYNYIMCGDFNFYKSTEPGYQLLMDSMFVDLVDPINSPGDWHDNIQFAAIHTQSTRTSQFSDYGAKGGLDDRFDFILTSHQITSDPQFRYVTGSYKAIGNDGNHLNLSVNDGTNGAVPQTVANALYYASDHLPVLIKLLYPVAD